MAQHDPYPDYSRAERIADGALHVAGLGFALTGTIFLVLLAAGRADPGLIAGLTIYGAAMIGSFLASALYHFTPWEQVRPLFRRVDHAAIFFKIAGTYTPLVVLIGTGFAYGVLALVWALALLGAVLKLFFWRRPGLWATGFYLLLGWLSVLLIWPLFPLLSLPAIVLIVAGGLTYTVGAVFFSLESLRFQNAIWHGHVLAASVCFFAAISLASLGTAA